MRKISEEKAAQMVAHLEVHFMPPYKLAGYMPVGAEQIEGSLKSVPADISAQEVQTIDDLLAAFRQFMPDGDFNMFAKGHTPGYENPGAFIGTDIVEKAARFRQRSSSSQRKVDNHPPPA